MNNIKNTTRTNLTPDNLEQAVGGRDSTQSIRTEMESIRNQVSHVSRPSEEYNKLENLKSQQESLTANNQINICHLSNTMGTFDNILKNISDIGGAHSGNIRSQFRI
ncbi:MAG: hypothetical protein WCP79_08290 [Bacillota bacterium]